jgi:hypothetical protein
MYSTLLMLKRGLKKRIFDRERVGYCSNAKKLRCFAAKKQFYIIQYKKLMFPPEKYGDTRTIYYIVNIFDLNQ